MNEKKCKFCGAKLLRVEDGVEYYNCESTWRPADDDGRRGWLCLYHHNRQLQAEVDRLTALVQGQGELF